MSKWSPCDFPLGEPASDECWLGKTISQIMRRKQIKKEKILSEQRWTPSIFHRFFYVRYPTNKTVKLWCEILDVEPEEFNLSRIDCLMVRKGWVIKELANAIGRSVSVTSGLTIRIRENNWNVHARSIRDICKALDVDFGKAGEEIYDELSEKD